MTTVNIGRDGIVVEAEIIAEAFDIPASTVHALMQSAEITSLCEKGVDEDEGRWRLTFYHGDRAFRLTVGDNNEILGQARFAAPRNRIAGRA